LSYNRKRVSVSEVVPVTVSVSVSKEEVSVSDILSVSREQVEKDLVFTSTMPLEDRIETYKQLYKDSTFIPNWILHGYLCKEDAIKEALKWVRTSSGVNSASLKV